MNRLIFLTIVCCLLAFPLVASANPSSIKLSLDYTSTGTLVVDVKFNRPTTSRCIARHRSSLYFEDDSLGSADVLRKSTHSRTIRVGRTSTSLRASGLPGVVQSNGQDPIVAYQVRLVCSGEPDITSNIEARFVRCGKGSKRVSLQKYLSRLKEELAKSS